MVTKPAPTGEAEDDRRRICRYGAQVAVTCEAAPCFVGYQLFPPPSADCCDSPSRLYLVSHIVILWTPRTLRDRKSAIPVLANSFGLRSHLLDIPDRNRADIATDTSCIWGCLRVDSREAQRHGTGVSFECRCGYGSVP